MVSSRTKTSSWGRLSSYRSLWKRSLMLRASRKRPPPAGASPVKRTRTDIRSRPPGTDAPVSTQLQHERVNAPTSGSPGLSEGLGAVPGDRWEVDSGFCSESSPPASGRSSPCPPAAVVALDCEMVGTGPAGRRSELARCSILDYHGNVLYDKYVLPCQPVTDFRTRWSGISRHHLDRAIGFTQARDEILSILEGKVVVGHAVYNDFRVLDMLHPGHMVRDTAATRLLSLLAGFHERRCVSLKVLTRKLLSRHIQVRGRGHCSVEDARAALDLYKLVEVEWERELRPADGGFSAADHYMQDRYWPDELSADGQ